MAVSAFSFQDQSSAPAVIACVDASPRSSSVAKIAARYARWLNRPLVLFHSIEFNHSRSYLPDPVEWHLRRREAQQYLETLRGDLSDMDSLPSLEVDEGNWHRALRARVATSPRPMVVIGSSRHGNTGHVAEMLIESGAGNLLVVPTDGPEITDSERPRIAIPIDGSKFAEAALAEGIAIARSNRAELLLVHVTPPSGIEEFGPPASRDIELSKLLDRRNAQVADIFLEQTLRRLRNQGLNARSRCLHGDPRSSLNRLIEEEAPELVILSTRGQGMKSCEDLSLGSTANYLLDHLNAPILLVGSSAVTPRRRMAPRIEGQLAGVAQGSLRGPLNVI